MSARRPASSGKPDPLLAGFCDRRHHLMYEVLGTRDGLVVQAPLFAAGRNRGTWTPLRRRLADGSGSRYGCGCGRTSLVADSDLLADIRRGVTARLEAA